MRIAQKVSMTTRSQCLSVGAAVSVLAALVAAAPASSAAPATSALPADAAARAVSTTFGMESHAYGTKIDRNRLLASGATANSVIACTTRAGIARHNNVAGVNMSPTVSADEVRSQGRTAKNGGVVSTTSRNTITSGSLLGGEVRFRGLSSQSRTWHDSDGFHNRIRMDLDHLRVGGSRVDLSGGMQRLDVSGLGTLTVFQRWTRSTDAHASARGVVLRLVLDDGTRVRVGHSYSHMLPRVHGPMGGATWGSQVEAAGGSVTSGRTAFQVMPCPGTNGTVRENATTGISLPNVVEADAVATHTWGVQRPDVQRGYTQAEVVEATLGDGDVVASGIQSKANVTRKDGTLSRDARGTRVLSLMVNGVDVRDELTPGVPFDVAGLGSITFKKVTPVPSGIDVVALEVVLLDSTVIELGHSIMRIKGR